jgi:ribosomal protein S18 acetylase RimI-like enzyme
VANDSAQFVAVSGQRVVGWADVLPAWPHALSHRGSLGIGVLPEFRGRGIGKRLLEACIAKAWSRGITRIDLESRADNTSAIRLYERLGFAREAVKRRAMRFDGVYYEAVDMCLLKDEE